MIIVRTPTRVSFCGGGSDLPVFYKKHGGVVLSAALNRYIYLSIHPYFYPDKLVCKYSKNELVIDPDDLEHPIFRTLLKQFGVNGVEITCTADVPAGTGLGSSSSFTVGLLHALYAYTGKYVSAASLAAEACHTEIEILGEPIGKQDQYSAAFGGLNLFRFKTDGSVSVDPVIMSPEATGRMVGNLLLFYTGDQRSASTMLSEQSKNIAEGGEQEKAQLKICRLTEALHRELVDENIDALGPILHAGWEQKRTLAKGITSPQIDLAYRRALKAGATGGKLLGAGGGGFLLFYVPEHRHNSVRNSLTDLTYMEFGLSRAGSAVIYVGDKPKRA